MFKGLGHGLAGASRLLAVLRILPVLRPARAPHLKLAAERLFEGAERLIFA
jgi:hypothetical protein